MAPLLPAIVFLGLGLPAASKTLHPDIQLIRGHVQAYGDWLAGCDSQGRCTIIGLPGVPSSAEPVTPVAGALAIKVTLSPDAQAGPVVELLPVPVIAVGATVAATGPLHMRLEAGGSEIGRHPLARTMLTPEEASVVVGSLWRGERVTGSHIGPDARPVRLPGSGFGRALRAIQAQRQRILEGSWEARAPTAQPSQARSRLRAVPSIVSGHPPISSFDRCEGHSVTDIRQFRFDDGASLWHYACSAGSNRGRSYWTFSRTADGVRRGIPLELPDRRDGVIHAGSDGLADAVFDFDFGILRAYQFAQGREDCGVLRAWSYDGTAWHLIHRSEMPLCGGIEQGDWIVTHMTPTDGVPEDG